MSLFYKPPQGWAGDVSPFYKDGLFYLFYLVDSREAPVDYSTAIAHGPDGALRWHLATTKDFLDFVEYGPILPQSEIDAEDYCMGTGSVIEKDGVYHLFHTGINERLAIQQQIIHATSPDLIHWQKVDNFLLPADIGRYESNDWRDPFVIWVDEHREYWMLIAARTKDGPSLRRGCTALATSLDLVNWKIHDPLWSPNLYFTHECPDLFQIGDWWYLIFSTFSSEYVTHYRMSRTPDGHWLCPRIDTFDTRAFYAAKTVSDGEIRYLIGWNPSKKDEQDTGEWLWGGNLVVHQIVQNLDGTLGVRMPDSIRRSFNRLLPLPSKWNVVNKIKGSISMDSAYGFQWMDLGDFQQHYPLLLEADLQIAIGTKNFGWFIRTETTLDEYIQIRIEPDRARIVVDRIPRKGDVPFIFERPIVIDSREDIRMSLLIDGTTLVCYFGENAVLTTRIYQHSGDHIGLFVSEGKMIVQGLGAYQIA